MYLEVKNLKKSYGEGESFTSVVYSEAYRLKGKINRCFTVSADWTRWIQVLFW